MKKKKIAYVELETHVEIIDSIIELLDHNSSFDIDFIVSEKVKSSLSNARKGNIIVATPSTLLGLLQKNQYDLVLIGTIHRSFDVFKDVSKYHNTAAIVHNLNFSQGNWSVLLSSIWQGQFLYKLKLILKEGLLYASSVYKNINHLLVLQKNMVTPSYTYLPIYYNKSTRVQDETAVLKIVIPGVVSSKKRDYNHVLNRIKTFTTEVELVFLGKANEKELQLIRSEEALLPKNIKFKYFENRVPSTIFEQEIIAADILWCPINVTTISFGYKETYGETKISGSIGDAIKYGKHAIFPAFYTSSLPFIVNEQNNLEEQMIQLKASKYDFQEAFSFNQIQTELIRTLQKLIDN